MTFDFIKFLFFVLCMAIVCPRQARAIESSSSYFAKSLRNPDTLKTRGTKSSMKWYHSKLTCSSNENTPGILLALRGGGSKNNKRRPNRKIFILWLRDFVRSIIINIIFVLVVDYTINNFIVLHVYDPTTVSTKSSSSRNSAANTIVPLYGLNVPKKKFLIWLQRHQGVCVKEDSMIQTQIHFLPNKKMKLVTDNIPTWWKEQRLLCLAPPEQERKVKFSLFCDWNKLKLQQGSKLFMTIVEDELRNNDDQELLTFLYRKYGRCNTRRLEAVDWKRHSNKAQYELMQQFLDWFRSVFPYYYDGCKVCGSVSRRELGSHKFLGCVHPTKEDLSVGRAFQTELYYCQDCDVVTSFPRFNAAMPIVESRRGRCGEYSLLLYRMLRVLGHRVRWVIDTGNDHVWIELEKALHENDDNSKIINNDKKHTMQQKWVHMDPCEAALNKNLLYQEWGRTLFYVFAFSYDPNDNKQEEKEEIPLIQDVTKDYITARRRKLLWLRGNVQKLVDNVSFVFQEKMRSMQIQKNPSSQN